MSDAETIAQIKSQTLGLIASVTAERKPTYLIDGQEVRWAEYLEQLRQTVAWCDARLAAEAPFEERSQGYT